MGSNPKNTLIAISLLFALLVILLSSNLLCSGKRGVTLQKIFGASEVSKCHILASAINSSFNDTIVGWHLSHKTRDVDSIRETFKFHKADEEDLKYASSEAMLLFQNEKLQAVSVYRTQSGGFDLYWLFDDSELESILIAYQY